MIVKKVEDRIDLENITELNKQQDFKLPDIKHCLVDRIVYENNQIVAYGIVKKMAEAIMLVNPNCPLPTRARAMRELMIIAEAFSSKNDCQQLHCFVKNENVARTLENKFGFKITKDMVLSKDL